MSAMLVCLRMNFIDDPLIRINQILQTNYVVLAKTKTKMNKEIL